MVLFETDNHNVINCLTLQLHLEWCSDVMLRCGSADTPISSHKAVLAKKSLLLSRCFADVPPCQVASVILPDFDRETVNLFITFLYTGFVQCNGVQRPLLFELFSTLCPEQCDLISVDEDIATGSIDSTLDDVVSHIKMECTNDFPDNLLEYETFEDVSAACLHDEDLCDYLIDTAPSDIIDANSDMKTANSVLDIKLAVAMLTEGNEASATSHSSNCDIMRSTSSTKECSVVLYDVMKSLDSYDLQGLTFIGNVERRSCDGHIPTTSTAVPLVPNTGLVIRCKKCGLLVSSETYDSHSFMHSDEKPYVCLVCKMRVHNLKVHMRVHTQEKPFSCEVCGMAFAQKSNVKLHMQKHSTEKTFSCEVCGKAFARKCYVKVHMRTHTGFKPFQCKYCNLQFACKKTLLSHTAQFHTNEFRFKCLYCDKGITTTKALRTHIKSKHTECYCTTCHISYDSTRSYRKHIAQCHASSPAEIERSISEQPENESDKPRCDYVERSKDDDILMKSLVKIKVQRSGGFNKSDMMNCARCGQNVSRASYKTHLDLHSDTKPYVCLVCKKRVNHLKIHMRVHTKEKPFACQVCGKVFTQMCHLKLHMRVHTRDKPFRCTYCNLLFGCKNTLLSHTARRHTNEYRFRCPYCNKGTTTKSGLLNHIRNKHSRESQHRCITCQTGFDSTKDFQKHVAQCRTSSPAETERVISQQPQTDSNNYVEHSKNYDGDHLMKLSVKKSVQCFGELNNSDMINCTRCGQNVSRASYNSHFDLHTSTVPYVCLVCNKRVNSLKIHMRVHTVEKPFVCEVCGKVFTQKCHVKLHMRVHTRDKPFQCLYCNLRFGYEKSLHSHTARQHTNEFRFACPYCNRGTTTKYDLLLHIRNKHSKKSLHHCITCQTDFDSTKSFQEHVAQCLTSTPTETVKVISEQA